MADESQTPEIDFNHLNQYVAGDADLTREIFGMFQHQVEMWLRMLKVDADDDTWATTSHSIKGSARAVGAMELGLLCERAETLIGAGRRPGSREVALQNIEFRVSKVITEIQRWEHRDKLNSMRS